jgi:hypothetical protein
MSLARRRGHEIAVSAQRRDRAMELAWERWYGRFDEVELARILAEREAPPPTRSDDRCALRAVR